MPNGRIVATHNGIYSTYYDPRTSQTRPEIEAQFVDFFDFRTNKEVGKTDGYYDYGSPSWLGSDQALTTSYGPYNAQVLLAKVGDETRGSDFYWDPGRFSDTGMNTHILTDAEATRAGDRFAVMPRTAGLLPFISGGCARCAGRRGRPAPRWRRPARPARRP